MCIIWKYEFLQFSVLNKTSLQTFTKLLDFSVRCIFARLIPQSSIFFFFFDFIENEYKRIKNFEEFLS